MEESLDLYNALREHILHKEDEITNETIYMFVTYFALLAISSVWESWLSLLSFIDLIIFQSMINRSQYGLTKAAIYIRVFFEEPRGDMHWETLNKDVSFLNTYSEAVHNIGWYILKYGASLLVGVSILYFILNAFNVSGWSFYALTQAQIAQIVIAFILCGITIYINRLHFHLRDDDRTRARALTTAIVNFKNNLSATHIK